MDPTGERTVGVLTKTDLIGPGGEDEVVSVVKNIRKPLALGYIMVKNRSQKDLIENVSSADARYVSSYPRISASMQYYLHNLFTLYLFISESMSSNFFRIIPFFGP